jgi:metal-responsive CopG/Arc/MetJ family transcriptional regulator
MTIISIRLPNKVLLETDSLAKVNYMSRAEYIRCAIEGMNHKIMTRERAQQLKKASLRVRKQSMRINREFDRIQ